MKQRPQEQSPNFLFRKANYPEIIRKQLMRASEEGTRTCCVCGAKALYRLYKKDGTHLGACKAHKQNIVAISRASFGHAD
jgi:hypothetical protein